MYTLGSYETYNKEIDQNIDSSDFWVVENYFSSLYLPIFQII
jgi:hypothetical protein